MATITKKDLIDRISEKACVKRLTVKRVVQEFLDQVISEIGKGNRLEFRDFGVFELRERAARMAQNPKTLERVPVPPRRTVKFKIGREMRAALEAMAAAQAAGRGAAQVPTTDDDAAPAVHVTAAAKPARPAAKA